MGPEKNKIKGCVLGFIFYISVYYVISSQRSDYRIHLRNSKLDCKAKDGDYAVHGLVLPPDSAASIR